MHKCDTAELTIGADFVSSVNNTDTDKILSCFPGEKIRLEEISINNDRLKNGDEPINPLAMIKTVIKREKLEIETLKQWRNNLQKSPDFETNHAVIQAIGMLTFGCGDIKHLALITDGDRRYAIVQKLPAQCGHNVVFKETLPCLVTEAFNYGLHTFTIWYWNNKCLYRNKEEVLNFIEQMTISLDIYLSLAGHMEIRIFRIGSPICSNNDPDIQKAFIKFMTKFIQVEQETARFTKHHLILAPNYDPEDDLLRCLKKIQAIYGSVDNIKYQDIVQNLDIGLQPYSVDLQVRPAQPISGGRTGDFLSFVKHYSYFTPLTTPELTMEELFKAAATFAHPLAQYRSLSSRYKDTHYYKCS